MEHTGPGSRTVVSFKAPASSSDHRGACLASARYGDAAEGVRSACILSAHAYLCQRMRISTCERRREVPASRWRVIRCALTRCAARRRAVDLGRHGACTRGIGRAWSRDTWTTALVASNAQVGPFGRADAAGCATAMGVDNKRSRRVARIAHRRTQEHGRIEPDNGKRSRQRANRCECRGGQNQPNGRRSRGDNGPEARITCDDRHRIRSAAMDKGAGGRHHVAQSAKQ